NPVPARPLGPAGVLGGRFRPAGRSSLHGDLHDSPNSPGAHTRRHDSSPAAGGRCRRHRSGRAPRRAGATAPAGPCAGPGMITFEQVTVTYPDASRPTLHDVDLRVEEG